MSEKSQGEAMRSRIASAEDIRHVAGGVSDHTVMEILGVSPTFEDVEVAVIHARGEGSDVDRLGHTLSGAAAQVFDILTRDDLYMNEEA